MRVPAVSGDIAQPVMYEVMMFEWHGWATIVGSPEADDSIEAEVKAELALQRVKNIVAGWPERHNEVLDLRPSNGWWHLWFAGDHNHFNDDHLQLFRQVAAAAPGSYGVMYVFDPDHQDRGWQRLVMKRGRVTLHYDADLSPHIGAVEDPWVDLS